MRWPVEPKFISDKWGWGLRLIGTSSVVYEDDIMLTFESEEEAIEWAEESDDYFLKEE